MTSQGCFLDTLSSYVLYILCFNSAAVIHPKTKNSMLLFWLCSVQQRFKSFAGLEYLAITRNTIKIQYMVGLCVPPRYCFMYNQTFFSQCLSFEVKSITSMTKLNNLQTYQYQLITLQIRFATKFSCNSTKFKKNIYLNQLSSIVQQSRRNHSPYKIFLYNNNLFYRSNSFSLKIYLYQIFLKQ